MVYHEPRKSRELEISKLVDGGWPDEFISSKLGLPRPYLLQFSPYENDSKRKVSLNDITNNFHVEVKS